MHLKRLVRLDLSHYSATSSIMSGLLASYQSAHARDMAFPTVIDTIPLPCPRRNLQLDQSAPVARIDGLAAYDAKLDR